MSYAAERRLVHVVCKFRVDLLIISRMRDEKSCREPLTHVSDGLTLGLDRLLLE